MATLTDLEREVAGRILRGEDPWGPFPYVGDTRRVSQVLGRLQRKNLIYGEDGQRKITDECRALLGGDKP